MTGGCFFANTNHISDCCSKGIQRCRAPATFMIACWQLCGRCSASIKPKNVPTQPLHVKTLRYRTTWRWLYTITHIFEPCSFWHVRICRQVLMRLARLPDKIQKRPTPPYEPAALWPWPLTQNAPCCGLTAPSSRLLDLPILTKAKSNQKILGHRSHPSFTVALATGLLTRKPGSLETFHS